MYNARLISAVCAAVDQTSTVKNTAWVSARDTVNEKLHSVLNTAYTRYLRQISHYLQFVCLRENMR